MLTIRIFSDDEAYARLNAELRKKLANALRSTSAGILHEIVDDVEAFWLHPFENESAENTLPYFWDVEYDGSINWKITEELAVALLFAFQAWPFIPEGTRCGVWIKTPGNRQWYEHEK